MEGSRLSRFPHLTWMKVCLAVPASGARIVLHMHGTTVALGIAARGNCLASRITHGQQATWSEQSGTVSWTPADHEQHTCSIVSDRGCELFAILIPQHHLSIVAESEGVAIRAEWAPILGGQDAVVHDCMTRLMDALPSQVAALDVGIDEVGFCSQSHFTRIFRDLTGMTPANYQKQARKAVG